MATTTIDIGAGTVTVSGQALAPDFQFAADPLVTRALISHFAGASIYDISSQNAENNVTVFLQDEGRGFLETGTTLNGVILNPTVLSGALVAGTELSGSAAPGSVGNSGADTLDVGITLRADWHVKNKYDNWVRWSKIGEFNFQIDRTNEAGERVMDWPGQALVVMELSDFAVVYGDKGVTVMRPVSEPATFGFNNLGQVGIKSIWSVAGTKDIHFFITSKGELWRFTSQGPEFLGFKEYLAPLTNPVLNYDETERILYINDGTTGYAFRDGLGGGYSSLTGIYRDFAVGSSALSSVPISIMSDILDLGHRGLKFITFIEVGTDTDQQLDVALDFRYSKSEAWRTSSWVRTNPEGVARVDIACAEFRVRVRQTVYDNLRIDYINIRHARVDKRFLRGPLFEQPQRGGEST